MTHSNQQSNSSEALDRLLDKVEGAMLLSDNVRKAINRKSVYDYIQANYLPREEVEAAIEQSLVSTDTDDSGIYDIVIDKDLLYYKLGLSINSGKRA